MQRNLQLSDITFGITSFERPQLLTQLVDSILRHYPMAKIVVADNGKRKAILPQQVQVLSLPFDCGLSAARNSLARQVKTKLMLLLEDDFFFLPHTRIDPLLEVLRHDEEVGVVGGAIQSPTGKTVAYSMEIECFRDTMYLHESNHRQRVTASGIPYRLCDVIWNFALFRKEMLIEHKWDESLKVGEHTPYFNEVKKAARWRVSCCPESVIYHVPHARSNHYLQYRRRAHDLFYGYLQRNGMTRFERVLPQRFENASPHPPNVLVLGVGHSGTSILTKMLHKAGWQAADADEEFGECVSIRRLNQAATRTGKIPQEAMKVLAAMPEPWVIKDPRFAWTLNHWLPLFAKLPHPPALVRICRDREAVIQSYLRRGAPGDVADEVRRREESCTEHFARWPWDKMTIQYEHLAAAAALFRQPVLPSIATSDQEFVAEHPEPNVELDRALLSDGSAPNSFSNLDDGSHAAWRDGPELLNDDGSTPLFGLDDGSASRSVWNDGSGA